jgi:hypothetical protein
VTLTGLSNEHQPSLRNWSSPCRLFRKDKRAILFNPAAAAVAEENRLYKGNRRAIAAIIMENSRQVSSLQGKRAQVRFLFVGDGGLSGGCFQPNDEAGEEAGGSIEVSFAIFRVAKRKNRRRLYERDRPRELQQMQCDCLHIAIACMLHLCRTGENVGWLQVVN